MKPEHVASAFVLVASAVMLGAVQTVPPLTQPTVPPPSPKDSRVISARIDERAYCEDHLQKVDCGCFSYRAGLVLNERRQTYARMTYMDRWELALAQARVSCALRS